MCGKAYAVTVDAAVPRTVVRQLHDDAHQPVKAIARICGVSYGCIRDLYRGDSRHVRTSTADALYALQAEVELAHPNLAAKWSLDAELAER